MKDVYWLPYPVRESAKAYCRMYPVLLEEYAALDGQRGIAYDADRGASVSDPTERIAERRVKLSRKLSIIEGACRYASESQAGYLLSYVSSPKVTYEALQEAGFRLNKNTLTKLVRKVYWRVAQDI